MKAGASSVPRRSVSRGFTLLEVLVALMIFVMAAAVLGSAYVNVLNGYDLAQRANARTEDIDFARAQLLAEPDHDKAEQGGEFDSANGRHVSYHAQIDPTQTADLFAVAFTCEITDPTAKKPETVTENFMVLRPTWSDATTNSVVLAAAKAKIAKLQGTAPPPGKVFPSPVPFARRSPPGRAGSPGCITLFPELMHPLAPIPSAQGDFVAVAPTKSAR